MRLTRSQTIHKKLSCSSIVLGTAQAVMRKQVSQASPGERLLYETEDGRTRVERRFLEDSLWLSQARIAELYAVSVKTANEHRLNIFSAGELTPEATIRKSQIVRRAGSRQVARNIDHYNLEAILAVGYRVRPARGVQFRRWRMGMTKLSSALQDYSDVL